MLPAQENGLNKEKEKSADRKTDLRPQKRVSDDHTEGHKTLERNNGRFFGAFLIVLAIKEFLSLKKTKKQPTFR